jgi:pSer/pThr/pTyr-binding forkhead associated (FHA) protein
MTALFWGALLLVMRVVLVLLIYLALFILLRAVRQEMRLRIESSAPADAAFVPGRLQITNPGGDLPSRLREIINLKTTTRVGAEPDNDLVLHDPFISAHHARLRWDGAGWWLEDLGSRNGSYIFQTRCPPNIPQPVPTGATLQLGGMMFTLME